MYLKLVRQPPEGEKIEGVMEVDGKYYCNTLERTSKAVLPLVYSVQVTMSPKFKRLLPLVMNVPGRTGIRIHRGSRPEHSQGCILVASDVEQSLTQLLLNAQQAHEEIQMEICDPCNREPDRL